MLKWNKVTQCHKSSKSSHCIRILRKCTTSSMGREYWTGRGMNLSYTNSSGHQGAGGGLLPKSLPTGFHCDNLEAWWLMLHLPSKSDWVTNGNSETMSGKGLLFGLCGLLLPVLRKRETTCLVEWEAQVAQLSSRTR